jgi:glycosyltransferase involved in cell wall biosynthesis
MASRVSLVITVYNRDRFLAAAIDSILSQTSKDFDLLIWDDGSTDNSLAIAQQYAERDHRVRVIPALHTGRQYALQGALSTCLSPYLGWVDSDDLLAPQALALTMQILDDRPEVGMVYTNHVLIDGDDQILGLGQRCQIPYHPQRLLVDFMTFHFRLLRRQVYQQVGGIDLGFPSAQDYDICLKISEVTQIVHLPENLYLYRTHPETISSSKMIEQRHYSAQAVRNALERRGLSDKYCLEVSADGRFQLIPNIQ